ncbi:MAG: hypothetical protein J7K17_02535 [Candidatus Omnitrophica bacterium]|nr:hypothetical protein [Candidatus Omnitrophota bacterium]
MKESSRRKQDKIDCFYLKGILKDEKESKRFSYHLTLKKIKEYHKIFPERKLQWLYYGNILRSNYSKKIIRLQEKFRKGIK